MTIDPATRQRLEAIVDDVSQRRKVKRSAIVWCNSAVEALFKASLTALTQELRRALAEDETGDFDLQDVELAISALSAGTSKEVDIANLRAGMSALFTLGGQYNNPTRELPFFDEMECSLEELGYTPDFAIGMRRPEAFSAICTALDYAVEAEVTCRIMSKVFEHCTDHLSAGHSDEDDEFRLEMAENIPEHLQEIWNHIGKLGPKDLCDPRIAPYLGIWWLYAYEDVVWVSGAPEQIHKDEQGRLHRDDGPAVIFADESKCWFWHGDQVPPSWLDGSLTRAEIENVNTFSVEYVEIAPHKAPEVLADILRSTRQ